METSFLAGNSESSWHHNCTAHRYLNNNLLSSSLFYLLLRIFNKYLTSIYTVPGRDAGAVYGEQDKKILTELTFWGEGRGQTNSKKLTQFQITAGL